MTTAAHAPAATSVVIFGAGAIVTALFVWSAYLRSDQLGANANMGKLLGRTVGSAVLGFRRRCHPQEPGRHHVELAFREIPPE